MAGSRDHAARIVRSETEGPGTARVGAASADTQAAYETRDEMADPVARTPAEAPATQAPSGQGAVAPAKPSNPRKRKVLMLVGVALALAGAAYGVNYYLVGRFIVSTDDAYVRATNTTLGSRVPGHIAAIVPKDNATVRAGDVIFRIDEGDYRLGVDAARTKIATQRAVIERIGQQVIAQQSAVEQAKAQLASADASAVRAELDFARQESLSTKGFASRATFESSQAGRDQGTASVNAAKAAYAAAIANVDVTKAQQNEARALLQELETALAKAERDLAFTAVKAPIDGVFSNRLVGVGDFVQAGQRLGNVVPLDDVYIDANFKETQLGRLKPGQPVRIEVDAYSHREIEGVVDSLSPAAGAVFTLLPPDNATGNFTKIVQRVPVRIRVPAEVAKENMMRAGMSVFVRINTKADAPR